MNAGTLVINGSISTSITTVNSGGTLGGIGTVGVLNAASGGTVAPGSGPGILAAGNTNLQLGSTFAVDINGATVSTLYDQLNVTGTVTLGGALAVSMGGGYTPGTNALFFILNNDGGDAIVGGSVFSNAPTNGGTYTFGGQKFEISYFGDYTGGGAGTFTGGNDVVLRAIPEPNVAALLGGLGLLALLRRRRH